MSFIQKLKIFGIGAAIYWIVPWLIWLFFYSVPKWMMVINDDKVSPYFFVYYSILFGLSVLISSTLKKS